jgi:hypothetical protein
MNNDSGSTNINDMLQKRMNNILLSESLSSHDVVHKFLTAERPDSFSVRMNPSNTHVTASSKQQPIDTTKLSMKYQNQNHTNLELERLQKELKETKEALARLEHNNNDLESQTERNNTINHRSPIEASVNGDRMIKPPSQQSQQYRMVDDTKEANSSIVNSGEVFVSL